VHLFCPQEETAPFWRAAFNEIAGIYGGL